MNLWVDGRGVVVFDNQQYIDPQGNLHTGSGGSSRSISLSEFWFAPNQFVDFTNPANIALFYSSGSPVNLGSSGQIPTGTAPAVYLNSPAAIVGTNSGTGGNFTVNGLVTSTPPP